MDLAPKLVMSLILREVHTPQLPLTSEFILFNSLHFRES